MNKLEADLVAQIDILHPLPELLYLNEFIRMPMRIKNTSSQFWSHSADAPIQLICRWLDAERTVIDNNYLRTALPYDLAPSANCLVLVSIQAPIKPGKYCLQFTMEQEHVVGLEKVEQNLQPLEIQLDVINVSALNQTQHQAQTKLRQALANAIEKVAVMMAEYQAAAEYQSWIRRYDTFTTTDIARIKEQIESWPHRPLISVIMPTYNTPHEFLRAAIESVQQQIYPHWELCIADDASTDLEVRKILQEYAANEPRIKLCFREQNGHISAASNSALELATGEYIALLDHDDMLAPHHLYFVAGEIINHPETEWIYFDTDVIDTQGVHQITQFATKPNLDLALTVAFMDTHAIFRTAKVRQVGGFRIGYEGSQDHDLGLRMLDAVQWQHIRHIPYVLYYWRNHSGSVVGKGLVVKPYAGYAGVKATLDYLNRHNIQATVTLDHLLESYRIRYALPENPPLVSIIIPTRNRLDLLKACIASILKKTNYPNYEILIVDNGSDEASTLAYLNYLHQEKLATVLQYPGKFNHSAINNYAASHAKGELLCLLNNDTEVINESWLTEMVSHALRPEIGIVGAQLWYENNTLQHAGVYIVSKALLVPLDHVEKGRQRRTISTTDLTSNFSATTGACMVMRKAVFQEVGGLNERLLPVSFNDVDLCFKVRQTGLRILYTPYAELYYYESISRGRADTQDETNWFNYMLVCWPELNLPDQFYRYHKRHTGLRRKIKIYQFGKPKLLFLHIPRTAGRSFRDIVAQEYEDDELFSFSTKLLLECYEQKSSALAQAQQYIKPAKAIFSQFWFGVHELLGLNNTTYVTLLREPIARTLSHYNHVIQANPHIFTHNISVVDMFRKGIIPGNLMTRIICGEKLDNVTWNEVENGPFVYSANFIGFGLPPEIWRGGLDDLLQRPDIPPANDPTTLNVALKNIQEHFYFVGLVENLTDAVATLGSGLNWDNYSTIPKLGENPNKLIAEVDEETLNVITEYNQLDIQLYQHIKNLPNSCFIKTTV